tara:strand:+ start:1054 stop:1656 length:603 start_codon:yes stop_codon:yes gene_type:complete
MSKTTPQTIQDNIDPKSRIISDVINNRYNKSSLNEIQTRLNSIKEDRAADDAVDDGELLGIALYSRTMPFEMFRKKYENNVSFYRQITDKNEKKKKSGFVREVYVHIPEISGMLPYPDFSIIGKHIEEIKSSSEPTDGFKVSQQKCEKELKKITMFPRFYECTTSAAGYIYNEICLVKSLRKEGVSSESLGKFLKIVDKT